MSTSRVALTSWPFTATWFPGDNLFLEHLSSPFSWAQLWDWHLSSHTMQLLAATPVFVASRMDNLKASLQVHPEASAASCGTVPVPQGSGHAVPRTPALHSWLCTVCPGYLVTCCDVQGAVLNTCASNCYFGDVFSPSTPSQQGDAEQLRMVPSRGLKSGHFLRNFLPLMVWQSQLFCVQGCSGKAICLVRLLPWRVVLGSGFLNSVFLLSFIHIWNI